MVGESKLPMRQGSPDDFQAPKEAIDVLLPYLDKSKTIWEPACGKRNIVNAFEEKGYKVIATDIKDVPHTDRIDFLELDKNLQGYSFSFHDLYGYIVTNPPYSKKELFLERCYNLGKPFALLMPLTALESEKLLPLFREFGIQLIIPNKRYNFETPTGKGKGAWFATAWFTWGLNLPKDLNFVDVKKSKYYLGVDYAEEGSESLSFSGKT